MDDRGRYELKYVIEESCAQAIAGYLRAYLRPSSYNRTGSIPGEPVVSLYFDSPDLLFYRQASNGLKNRLKLRVRYYDQDHNQPAFLEIKRRVSDVICKERARVSRDSVQQILLSGPPHQPSESAQSTWNGDRKQASVWQQFRHVLDIAHARAMLYCTYYREAFVESDGGSLRVTFDRQIRATQYNGQSRLEVPVHNIPLNPLFLRPNQVVLELKYNGGCPQWMQHMVRTFNLQRRSVSKYCACVEALGLMKGRQGGAADRGRTVA